jgi:Na+-transporting methylmalonyl-CoA/oxaloacetate decarboxylase gamma subunit
MNQETSLLMQDALTISLVGIVIVFVSLIILYKSFDWISKLVSLNIRSRLRRQGKEVHGDTDNLMIPADHSAAIAMALYLYYELHDEESNVLTIDRVSRNYSPWSSKIYSMRRLER